MKRVPTFRKLALLLLAVFAAWAIGIVCWNSSATRHPMAGAWESRFLTQSTLTVHADGTFLRTEDGVSRTGTWKPIKAWKTDDFVPPGAMIRWVWVPYHTDEEVEADSDLRDLRHRGGLHPIENAFLLEENGNRHVVVPVRDKNGDRLEANALEWNYRRAKGWPERIAELPYLFIPERMP